MSRIALVHYTAPPVIGGVERILAEQSQTLHTLGHEVSLFTKCDESLATFDVVIVHNVFTMPFNLQLTASLRSMARATPHIRWINWVHDVAAINPHYAHLPWEQPNHQQLTLPPPHCHHVAVSAVRQNDYAQATGLSLDQIQVIPNGVDTAGLLGLTNHVRLLTDHLQLWQRDIILVHPTRIVRRKNIELGLQITGALRDDKINVAYLVTGAPDPHNSDHRAYSEELSRLIADLDLHDHTFFVGQRGPLADTDIRSLYALSDALLFPSISEGFGLPVIEATLHDLPVFCSEIPAHTEVAPPTAHFFALDDDPAQIAAAIASDPDVLRRSNRRTLHFRHDWSHIASDYLEPLLSKAIPER